MSSLHCKLDMTPTNVRFLEFIFISSAGIMNVVTFLTYFLTFELVFPKTYGPKRRAGPFVYHLKPDSIWVYMMHILGLGVLLNAYVYFTDTVKKGAASKQVIHLITWHEPS